jgi:hypothetical protein
MDMPRDENDLSDVERRLAGWQPASPRLDADAMLFAAGHAAGRGGRGRWFWPALSVLLAVLACGLGAWGLSERAERQVLASQLRERAVEPGAAPATGVAAPPGPAYRPSLDDYLHLRQLLDQDSNGAPVSTQPPGAQAGDPPPQPAILTPRQRDGLLEQ